ncbi:hypothetical protein FACS1894116_01400 [Betaproteobacteria bacterium]|nr:hypothetical protein FACS1894116_01400 [Betaproteobacteria bacterium]GHU24924.1 hypothetical protein FACS189488_10660 [Betaproteobacteria bacterium]GHU28451.1 hypothetical protein FACS189497_03940 [Betaproteobacteria bacterium]
MSHGIMKYNVLGVSRYNFDGASGTKVFTQQPSEAGEDVLGIEVVEYSGDLSLFDNFKNTGVLFPAEFECEVNFVRGARGKAAVRILTVKPIKPVAAGAAKA